MLDGGACTHQDSEEELLSFADGAARLQPSQAKSITEYWKQNEWHEQYVSL
jgi:hypothetical protein